ncbi:hypothetical protein MRB53_017761 [Persea americana]|uniref:Uncharacterized protein n=1 Tax=Persea americana TaxID=3435 RepID=A0ACC2M5K6_PERAE|nr:hypothetical protein MRB53_017761 [Persea americana]
MQCLLPDVTVTASRKLKDMVSKGLFEDALRLYKDLLRASSSSSGHTDASLIPSLLKAASASLPLGLQLHSFLLKTARDKEPVTANSLISMYSRCRDVHSARLVFDTMPPPTRDAVTWNSIIMCYVRNDDFLNSIQMFKLMFSSDFRPLSQLIASVVSLSGRAGYLRLGMQIHAHAICSGISDVCSFLPTALIDMYSRCRDLHSASMVFQEMSTATYDNRNGVSWTAMITGCAVNGDYLQSLAVFRAMQFEGMKPNRVTLVSILPSCAELGALRHGKEIHAHIFRHGYGLESCLEGALVDMYCKCGREALLSSSKYAWIVFERAEERRDVVVWSSIIGSYSRRGDAVKTMSLFHQMRMEGIGPNSVTLLAVIGACTSLSSAGFSSAIHGYAVKSGLDSEVFVGNSLIDMYAKCGCLKSSSRVFEEMPVRDPVSWSALISCYGRHGRGNEALRIFHEMREEGIEPDEITLLAVLSACNHAGLVDQAQQLFNQAPSPGAEHYACLVDLLGRAGRLEDACQVVNRMPMGPSLSIWGSLVCACRVLGRFDLAETVAWKIIDLEPENAANYTLLSMIYAEAGDWAGIEEARKLMKERGLKNRLGYSRVEVEVAT